MNLKQMFLATLVGTVVLTGCSSNETETPKTETEAPAPETNETTDAVTYPTQAVVTDEASLVEAGKAEMGWITLFQGDVTTDKEIVFEGLVFKKDKESGEFKEAGRKVALYDQDADKNKTAAYTLTAPKLTISTNDSQLRGGTFVGELVIAATNVALKDMTIEGNIVFASQEAKDTFTMDETTSVTGTQTVAGAEVDAVTYPTQSVVTDAASLKEAGQPEMGWITLFEGDVTVEEEIVFTGDVFKKNRETGEFELAGRKLALYAQDADKNKTAAYTLTTPQLTIATNDSQIRGGKLIGDLVVAANNVVLKDMVIEGNVVFATQEAMDTFTMDETSSVTGSQELAK